MPYFGSRSKEQLNSAHKDLQRLFEAVVKHYDCSIIQGYRTQEDQEAAFSRGLSKKRWPDSKHNTYPSLAVDAVPWFSRAPHIRWDDDWKFYEFAGYVQGVATMLGIELRWGGNWDMDDELRDQTFMDLGHFELVRSS